MKKKKHDLDLESALEYIEHLEGLLDGEDEVLDLTPCPKCESTEWSRMFYESIDGSLAPTSCTDCPYLYDHH